MYDIRATEHVDANCSFRTFYKDNSCFLVINLMKIKKEIKVIVKIFLKNWKRDFWEKFLSFLPTLFVVNKNNNLCHRKKLSWDIFQKDFSLAMTFSEIRKYGLFFSFLAHHHLCTCTFTLIGYQTGLSSLCVMCVHL